MLQCNTIQYNTKTGETNHVTMQHHTLQHQDRRKKSYYSATPVLYCMVLHCNMICFSCLGVVLYGVAL
jgi:hypothetical protein